ncbi:putative inactive poly [ADP-ribose] polymerase SRO5 isoform X2 [Silene latifolia]|uniref:putative inactive poly [ADP-ribose] polymerase SRO5 isoform X2 n=1 Tax=Silene latifolia TaxID=37657 RepID=UPI003D77D25E
MESTFHVNNQNSSPEMNIPYDDESASDCESSITTSSSSSSSDGFQRRLRFDNVSVEIPDSERSYELIRRRFLAGIGDTAVVVAVHRKNWSEDSVGQARVRAFKIYGNALKNKYGNNGDGDGDGDGGAANLKFGWYGGDKQKIIKILRHGFSYEDLLRNNHGAVLLSPVDSPASCVEDSVEDEDGLRHVLLCRVLLGRSELIKPGSGQTHPSSNKYDSGVDSYDNPKKYLIWSSNMNTHILPEFVVTFKVNKPAQLSSTGVVSRMKNVMRMPRSPWISFPQLTSVLARFLTPDAIALISKYHRDYRERRISRPELIQKVRQIAGDKMLIGIIRSFKSTKGMSFDFRGNHNNN